ncbi:hypothetical protein T265_05571 [Opisthorchis viverrini]|uniref:Glycosyltransferase, family 8 n=1 Tax=Opisthorchis viverrini TaxID=6198 RepID=A0A075AF62_OPIVI|nr:hypothetical protein T265_05571 [Opisthorchis viverrini]KER27399.1 hypothetical protein T265_05571 [Opisthorchis viverrini]
MPNKAHTCISFITSMNMCSAVLMNQKNHPLFTLLIHHPTYMHYLVGSWYMRNYDVSNIQFVCLNSNNSSVGLLASNMHSQDTIHITQFLKGTKSAARSVTMLKSLLYFQNRLRSESQECLRYEPFQANACNTEVHPMKNPIHVHFVADHELWPLLKSQLHSCKLAYLTCSFYNLENYYDQITINPERKLLTRLLKTLRQTITGFALLGSHQDFSANIPNTHHSGPTAMAKLWAPYILPHWLEKTIVVDSDTLWNENIYTLWNHFNRFNSTQVSAVQASSENCLPCEFFIITSVKWHFRLLSKHTWLKPTTGFALLGAHQVGCLRVSVNFMFYLKPNCTKLAQYTHLQTNLVLRQTQLEPFEYLMIGIAWEQQSDDLGCNRSSKVVIPPTGVNSGLVLMNLWRMRYVRWDAISERMIIARLKRDKIFYQSDQAIYNDIIPLKPEWYYPLACEWNVQLYSSVAVQCCPTVWSDRRPKVTHECSDINRNMTGSYGYALLVHCDGKQKPEESYTESPESLSPPPSGRPLTIEELRSRYFDVYVRFRKIPINCFV